MTARHTAAGRPSPRDGLPGRYAVARRIEARTRGFLQLVNTEGGAIRIPERAQRMAADTGCAESHPRPSAMRSVHTNVERVQLASAAVVNGSRHGRGIPMGSDRTSCVWLNRADFAWPPDLSL